MSYNRENTVVTQELAEKLALIKSRRSRGGEILDFLYLSSEAGGGFLGELTNAVPKLRYKEPKISAPR